MSTANDPRHTVNGSHEAYIHAVRSAAIAEAVTLRTITPEQGDKLAHTRLVYGLGLRGGYRGVTVYGTWQNGSDAPDDTVEIAAVAEESWLQLGCTTLHELGHVLGGHSAGHSEEWKEAASRLGLRRAKAAGMRYSLAALRPTLRETIYRLAQDIGDGSPSFLGTGIGLVLGPRHTARPCSAGIGTRGGKSRGVGSGSRLLKAQCTTCGYVARVTRLWLERGAPFCGTDVEHGRMESEVAD